MDCAKIKKLLPAYMDGDLDARLRETVQAHVGKCDACNKELLSLKELIKELESLDDLEAPKDFMEKVYQRIENPSCFHRIRSSLFFPPKIKIPLEIAGLAAAAAVFFFIYNTVPSDGSGLVIPGGNGKTDLTLLENRPVQLTIRLGPAERTAPLSPENVVTVTSNERRKGTNQNGFGWDHLEQNYRQWILEDPFEYDENPFPDQSRGATNRNDFISDINMIVTHLKGRLLSKEYREGSDILQYITLEIPVENYRPFLTRVERICKLRPPAPELLEGHEDPVRIRIRIISE